MGEYYTPDWLAQGITRKVVNAPLSERILDPACGSGTFLFQAIRKVTSEAELAGWTSSTIVEHIQSHVFGLDIHPVSVMLARVTYLLALGKHLQDREDLWVPVHLGDSMQWYQPDNHDENVVRIDTEGPDLSSAEHTTLFSIARTLVFPLTSFDDTDTFDQLVSAMTNRAKEYTDKELPRPKIEPILKRFGITRYHDSFATLSDTFNLLCDLNAEGKDSIWGFYVRNQVRPLWLSMPGRKVDVLLGNPPWVAYRYMTPDLQSKYKAFAEKYRIWEGGNVAPQQDLVALFAARAIDKYLNDDGTFGFVTPYSVLSRRAYDGFRRGKWGLHLRAHFTELWDLHELKPNNFFPVPAAAVFGTRSEKALADSPEPPHGFPGTKIVYSGKFVNLDWETTKQSAIVTEQPNVSIGKDTVASSPYNEIVVNGATIFPKVLTFIREVNQPNSKLGQRAGMTALESLPSVHKPWRSIPPLTATLPNEYIFEVHQGSTILPFRSLPPSKAVLPILDQSLLTENQIDSGDE
ncbi:N-6 DNA methylase, partial [Brevibacterium metallidurans]